MVSKSGGELDRIRSIIARPLLLTAENADQGLDPSQKLAFTVSATEVRRRSIELRDRLRSCGKAEGRGIERGEVGVLTKREVKLVDQIRRDLRRHFVGNLGFGELMILRVSSPSLVDCIVDEV